MKEDSSSLSCAIAMSRIETTILTPTGDVLVCRSRDSEFMKTERTSVWMQQEHKDDELDDDMDGSVSTQDHNEQHYHTSNRLARSSNDLGPELCALDDSFCNPCATGLPIREGLLGGSEEAIYQSQRHLPFRGGLLGGAPEEETMEVMPDHQRRSISTGMLMRGRISDDDSVDSMPLHQRRSNHHRHHHIRNNRIERVEGSKENCTSHDCDELAAPPSFDYSHLATPSYAEPRKPLEEVSENNESTVWDDKGASSLSKYFGSLMSPAEPDIASRAKVVILQAKEVTPSTLRAPSVMHGVPTCLPTLSEIRITQISAHPLGSHVLLISSEALLFSYGRNDFGQLGLGMPLDAFVRSPTLVTAVLEGGGKTESCSAGVRHSLIVVKTEEQRVLRKSIALQRVTSSPSRLGYPNSSNVQSSLEPKNVDDLVLYHHQIYGFGASRNLGLMNPPTDGSLCVALPHRVALHAKVWPEQENAKGGLPSAGVFQVAASVNHSAALVRRATGAIELYTWGEESLALGTEPRRKLSTVPTKVQSLSSGSSDAALKSGSHLKESEHLEQVYLGPDCTFVMTNTGRCMSFGANPDGLLGIGKPFAPSPIEIAFPTEKPISSVSIGAQHAMATTSDGKVYVWGADPATRRTTSRPEPVASLANAAIAFAGYDASALVTQSGIVQTFGQKSGRLGQGEVPPNPRLPTRLFGGLRLWRALVEKK